MSDSEVGRLEAAQRQSLSWWVGHASSEARRSIEALSRDDAAASSRPSSSDHHAMCDGQNQGRESRPVMSAKVQPWRLLISPVCLSSSSA